MHAHILLKPEALKHRYDAEFARVLVVSFDGSTCNGLNRDLFSSYILLPEAAGLYGIAPHLPLLGGLLRFGWPGLRRVVPTSCVGQTTCLKDADEQRWLLRYLRPNLWRQAALASRNWRAAYDGPSHAACASTFGAGYSSGRKSDGAWGFGGCGQPCSDWLGVSAMHTCVDAATNAVSSPHSQGVRCAGHVTLVADVHLAKQATARVQCFVESKLGWSPSQARPVFIMPPPNASSMCS